MNENPFEDLAALRAAEKELQPAAQPPAKVKPRRREQGFVVLPAKWLMALYSARPPVRGVTWIVAVRLIERFCIEKAQTIRLTNGVLAARGVGRQCKRLALEQLAALGLIRIEQRGLQAPMVTWLVDPNG
jgi:hypothetical protein